MKITVIGGPFQPLPPAPGGAVERIWHGLAGEFARRGHAVTVLCRRHPGQAADEEAGGVRFVRFRWPPRRSRTAWNLVSDLLYSGRLLGELPRADVTVTNTFWMPALLGCWNPTAGLVAVHVARPPKGQYWLYRGVDRFQAESTAIRDMLAAQAPRLADRVRVFPNPIPTHVFTPPPGGRGGRATRTVLYTGRVHPEKGLDLLVPAFRRLAPAHPDLRLRVVGPWRVEQGGGGPEYRDKLRAAAAGLAVEFVEPVFDPARLTEEYRAADFYCYPSVAEKGEAFGVAPLEAMATGLPTVVSALACFRDFLTDGRTGAVFDHRGPDPVGALAGTLGGLVADPARAARMAAAAAARAAELSYERVADLYLDDFAEMVRNRGRGRRCATGPRR